MEGKFNLGLKQLSRILLRQICISVLILVISGILKHRTWQFAQDDSVLGIEFVLITGGVLIERFHCRCVIMHSMVGDCFLFSTAAVENVVVQSTDRAAVVVTWSPLMLPGWTPSYYLIYSSHLSANPAKVVSGNSTSAEVDIGAVPVDGMDLEIQVSAAFSLGLEGVGPFEGAKSDRVSIALMPGKFISYLFCVYRRSEMSSLKHFQ